MSTVCLLAEQNVNRDIKRKPFWPKRFLFISNGIPENYLTIMHLDSLFVEFCAARADEVLGRVLTGSACDYSMIRQRVAQFFADSRDHRV